MFLAYGEVSFESYTPIIVLGVNLLLLMEAFLQPNRYTQPMILQQLFLLTEESEVVQQYTEVADLNQPFVWTIDLWAFSFLKVSAPTWLLSANTAPRRRRVLADHYHIFLLLLSVRVVPRLSFVSLSSIVGSFIILVHGPRFRMGISES